MVKILADFTRTLSESITQIRENISSIKAQIKKKLTDYRWNHSGANGNENVITRSN